MTRTTSDCKRLPAVEALLMGALLLAAGAACAATPPHAKQDARQDAAPPPASNEASQQQASQPAEQQISLPTGTVIQVRVADEINSSHDYQGELLTGIVDPSVLVNNHVVIPRGTEAHMRVMFDKKGHALGGKAEERVELVSLVMNQEKLSLDSSDYYRSQKPLDAKVKNATHAGAGSATAAAGTYPEAGGVSPIIAAFSAAKVDVRAGTRIPFTLQTPFTFGDTAAAASVPPPGSAIPAPDGSR